MRLALDLRDFERQPIGACLAGRSFLYYWPRPHLCGFALWGASDTTDFAAIERVLLLELTPEAPPHVSLVDASRVEAVQPNAFGELNRYVDRERARLRQKVERLAIVRPPGITGATVSGFFHVTSPPYPVDTFADAKAALEWLGEPDDGVLDEIASAVADSSGAPPWLVGLRRMLEAERCDLDLATAAKLLGLSPRSLQRQLQGIGSTFVNEVAHVQVGLAKRLLSETSTPLSAIAHEIGCSNPQHFSVLFRKWTGESPSAYRARTRGADRT